MKKKLITTMIIIGATMLIAGCGAKEKESNTETSTNQIQEESESIKEKVDLSTYNFRELTFGAITGTSVLDDGHGISYDPMLIIDNNKDTAWVEGVDGNGINEGITLDFGMETMVKEFTIVNGYAKSSKLYYDNNRVKRVKLEFSDGSTVLGELQDGISSAQSVKLDKGIKTSSIKVTILDVYNGDKYEDTCIGEIDIKGYGDVGSLNDAHINELSSKEFTGATIAEETIQRNISENTSTSSDTFTEDDAQKILDDYYTKKGEDTTNFIYLFRGPAIGNKDGFDVIVQLDLGSRIGEVGECEVFFDGEVFEH